MIEPIYDMAVAFNHDGYITLNLDIDCQPALNEVKLLNTRNLQAKGYHYSEGHRYFDAWKQAFNLWDISMNNAVFTVLQTLYSRAPYPFQTITFDKGSNQPLHSDVIHFDSIPHRWLAAAWIALEDMTEENGPLMYVPGSHKLPIFDFYDLNIKVPKYGEQFDSYAEYEQFIDLLVKEKELEPQPLICKAGTVLIWAANLIHGGAPILNPESTRYSHVTHYYFDGCDKYYSPMFSEAWQGKFNEKDLTEKNIRGF